MGIPVWIQQVFNDVFVGVDAMNQMKQFWTNAQRSLFGKTHPGLNNACIEFTIPVQHHCDGASFMNKIEYTIWMEYFKRDDTWKYIRHRIARHTFGDRSVGRLRHRERDCGVFDMVPRGFAIWPLASKRLPGRAIVWLPLATPGRVFGWSLDWMFFALEG